jgi:trans-aconitate methyltransferase
MKDLNIYKLRLSQSMEDKLFFLNKVDIDSYDFILDFGCGTGELLNAIRSRGVDPDKLFGLDTNEEMIEHALHTYPYIKFMSSLEPLEALLKKSTKSMVIFSSVLHEIDDHTQRKLIHTVMTKFDTVVIRDMKQPLNNEPIPNRTRKRVLAQVAPWQAEMFENKWGKIVDKYGLYRFFLMNEFVENFETEVEEDYFGVLWGEIIWALEDAGFDMVYASAFTLPYRKHQVQKRFSHVMNDITHKKIIYTKRGK